MPAFTLYTSMGSSNGDRVRLTLADGGFTDYELVQLNLFTGEQKSKENMERHPWGKVPSVVFPDGFTLYESRAICKYLARKFALPLLPAASDIEATGLFEQAEGVEGAYFADPAGKLGFEKFIKPIRGMPVDEAVVADMLKSTEAYFDIAEQQLQKKNYMAGSNFSLVDIYYIPLILRLFNCGYGDVITQRKAVNAWWERCTTRPAIQKLIAADKEAIAAAMAARK